MSTRREKIELTINADYLPTWGRWEGIRELYQNGIDAAQDQGTFAIGYAAKENALLFANEGGALLDRSALLLGTTSKSDTTRYAGKFGEGLKLGVLALVRAGCEVTIQTGDEVWEARFAHSKKFNRNVLCFLISTGHPVYNGVRVVVEKIPEWPQFSERFLFSNEKGTIETCYGDVLTDSGRAGQVFVKGIWVQTDPKLQYGYNFRTAEVDRDRKMVADWDLVWRTGLACATAAEISPEFEERLHEALERGDKDVQEVTPNYVSKGFIERTVARFEKKYGDSALPCGSVAEASDLEHLGARGIQVSKPLGAILGGHFGDVKTIQAKLKMDATRLYDLDEVTTSERINLDYATELLEKVGIRGMYIKIADFRNPDLLGQYKVDSKQILISRRALRDKWTTVQVLIHESAHAHGSDGDKGHVWNIEQTWKSVCELLDSKKQN